MKFGSVYLAVQWKVTLNLENMFAQVLFSYGRNASSGLSLHDLYEISLKIIHLFLIYLQVHQATFGLLLWLS